MSDERKRPDIERIKREAIEQYDEEYIVESGFSLNIDETLELLDYIERLEAENAALREELASREREIDHLINSWGQD